MTPDERNMLTDLAAKISQAPVPQHDPEAEELIRSKIGSRPDALYLMTQTVLIQNMAIEHAKQEIQELQQRAAQGQAHAPALSQQAGSFAGSSMGQTAPAPQQRPQSWSPQTSQSSPQMGGGFAAPPPSQYGAPAPASGGSSFLRSAATTAAGVAAGALAFEGIRSLFSGIGNIAGFGGGQGFGSNFGGGMPHGSGFLGDAGSETIINNYYDSPGERGRDDSNAADRSSRDDESADQVNDSSQNDDSANDTPDDSSDDTSYSDPGDSGSSDV